MCDYIMDAPAVPRPAVGTLVEYVERSPADLGVRANDFNQSRGFFGTKGFVITVDEFVADLKARYGDGPSYEEALSAARTPVRWIDKNGGGEYIGSAYTAFLDVVGSAYPRPQASEGWNTPAGTTRELVAA